MAFLPLARFSSQVLTLPRLKNRVCITILRPFFVWIMDYDNQKRFENVDEVKEFSSPTPLSLDYDGKTEHIRSCIISECTYIIYII